MVKEVDLPDGSVGEFPDDMPDAAIAEVLRKQYPVPDSARKQRLAEQIARDRAEYDPSKGMSPLAKLAVGAGAATTRAGRAIGHLLPAWKDDPRLAEADENAELYRKYHPGGWATAGEIAADVGMSAIPVARGGQVLTKALSKLGTAAPLVADVAANAGYSAITAPEDRGAAAALGGTGALVGRGLNRVASGLVKPTATAQELLDQGVRLTPGQAGGGRGVGALASTYEKSMQGVPGLGAPVSRARQEALEDWNRSVLQSKLGGRAGLEEIKAAHKKAYNEIFKPGLELKFSPEMGHSYYSRAAELADNVSPSGRAKFEEIAAWIGKKLDDGLDASHWKSDVSKEIDTARKAALRDGNHSLFVALNSLDDQLTSNLARFPGMSKASSFVGDLDASYRNLKTIEQTMNRAGPVKRGGVFYPDELATTAAKRGDAKLLTKALAGQQLLGQHPSEFDKLANLARTGLVGHATRMAVGAAALPATTASLLGTTEPGRRFLLGQIPWQRLVQQHPEVAAQVVRSLTQQQVQGQ